MRAQPYRRQWFLPRAADDDLLAFECALDFGVFRRLELARGYIAFNNAIEFDIDKRRHFTRDLQIACQL